MRSNLRAQHLLAVMSCQMWSFTTERRRKMEEQSKREESIGFTPPSSTDKGNVSVQPKSLAKSVGSLASTTAPIAEGSSNLPVEASASKLLAAQILAVQVMMGDFKGLKDSLPTSWQASSNGKIYWCAQLPDHKLSIVDGNLLVNGVTASRLLEDLLAEKE
jgi:hypothetical protein